MNLSEILASHKAWFQTGDGVRADLSGQDLSGVDLSGADLSDADLTRANLKGANLASARLVRANLTDANLKGANLAAACLNGANARRAFFSGADLTNASLRRGTFIGSDFTDADLTNADLANAGIEYATLVRTTLPPLVVQLPDGDFTAWKKVDGEVILELVIPADARRTASLVGRKCRADSARVVSAVSLKGLRPNTIMFFSIYKRSFVYTVGEVVTEPLYDDDIRTDCSHGIHFFATREEAVAYKGF